MSRLDHINGSFAAALLMLGWATFAQANDPADYAGTYGAYGPNGEITLELEIDEQRVLHGEMRDDLNQFVIAAGDDGRGVSGHAVHERGEQLGFVALLDDSGDWLAAALIPMDVNGLPIPAQAELISFQRSR